MKDYYELQKLVGNQFDAPGFGGNISVKSEGCLYIKASGQDMKNPQHQYTIIRGDEIHGMKPSMEYKMHQNISSKYVVHYHPIYVMPYLCSNYTFNFGYTLDYFNPGQELADAVKNLDDKNVIWLKNHGVLIHADSLQYIKELYVTIKHKFLYEIPSMYTPDDVIDSNSEELLLFRHYIEAVAQTHGLVLNTLSSTVINKLKNDEDEKYRQKLMKTENK